MHAHEHLKQDFYNREQLLKDPRNKQSLAALIDHTLLRPDAGHDDFTALARQAAENSFRAICLPSSRIEAACELLNRMCTENTRPVVCTVIGFPHGNSCTEGKSAEIAWSRKTGAQEFDYVQNLGWVRDKNWNALRNEAQTLVTAAQGGLVKVILETAGLNPEEIFESALAAARGGVHVLKTSTGYASRGALVEDMVVLSRVAEQIQNEKGIKIGIKASGGVRTFDDALRMIRAGATRLGTSGGTALLSGQTADEKSY
jgi:deoxyribose-phosphate aldolase